MSERSVARRVTRRTDTGKLPARRRTPADAVVKPQMRKKHEVGTTRRMGPPVIGRSARGKVVVRG